MSRDWEKEPPRSLEEGLQLAESIAGEACKEIREKHGQLVRYERKGNSILIIWPGGEVTHEIEIEHIH